MTFDEFKASGKNVSNLHDYNDFCEGPGRVYCNGALVIQCTANWDGECKKSGKWFLSVRSQQYQSDDLEELEKELYEFAVDEDYTLEG
jgi:hypothetical protein